MSLSKQTKKKNDAKYKAIGCGILALILLIILASCSKRYHQEYTILIPAAAGAISGLIFAIAGNDKKDNTAGKLVGHIGLICAGIAGIITWDIILAVISLFFFAAIGCGIAALFEYLTSAATTTELNNQTREQTYKNRNRGKRKNQNR